MTRKQYTKESNKAVNVDLDNHEKKEQEKFEQIQKSELHKSETFQSKNMDQIFDMFYEVIDQSYILEKCNVQKLGKFLEKPYTQNTHFNYDWYKEHSQEVSSCYSALQQYFNLFNQQNCTFNQWISFCYCNSYI